jgi:hypothetical protein
MKVFTAPEFEREKIVRFLSDKIRKKGIINRENCESLEVRFDLLRPFRFVKWECSGDTIVPENHRVSLIDEDLAPIVKDLDDQLLLWRPKYSSLKIEEFETINQEETNEDTGFHLQSVIDDLVRRRSESLEILMTIDSDLHKIQRDAMSATSLVLPRSPSSPRKEAQLVDEKKLNHSIVVATSLVTNCLSEDQIKSGHLGDRVYVKTIAAEYIDKETSNSRWVFLEIPGAKSINDALKQGRALTRICSLNEQCKMRIKQSI